MIIKLADNNEIEITIYNARNILVKLESKLVHIVKKGNVITELNFSDNFHIEVGDLFPLISNCNTKTTYTVEIIKLLEIKNKKYIYMISCELINKTSHWLLPFVGKDEEELGYNTILRNAYIFNNDSDFYNKGYTFLKYAYLKEYDYFLNKLSNHLNCVNVNRLYSRYEYLYTFRIPAQWINDTNLIMEGKYSQISDEAKKRILSFHKLNVKGETGNILYKDKDYLLKLQREYGIECDILEFESKFNNEFETLK